MRLDLKNRRNLPNSLDPAEAMTLDKQCRTIAPVEALFPAVQEQVRTHEVRGLDR
jgi:hypothetical protein